MSLKLLPKQVTIQLVDGRNRPIRMANVLFGITAFASRKNDYHLQPFGTDSEGLAKITKDQLEAEVAANLSSGLNGLRSHKRMFLVRRNSDAYRRGNRASCESPEDDVASTAGWRARQMAIDRTTPSLLQACEQQQAACSKTSYARYVAMGHTRVLLQFSSCVS